MNRLKEVREEKEISQVKLSEMSGISRQRINLMESNPDCNVTTDTLEALAAALGVEVSAIYFPAMPTKIDN